MKITSLIENTVYRKNLWAEEGLSFLIESNDPQPLRILFDCGRSGVVAINNMKTLQVEIDDIQYLVLSHGHSGHIGGTMHFISKLANPCVVLHSSIFRQKYKKIGKQMEPSGNQPSLINVKKTTKIKHAENPIQLSDHVFITGQIPLKSDFEKKNNYRYYVEGPNGLEPDTFEEEIAVILKTGHGLLILTSCGHRGIINTIEYCLSLFQGDQLFGLIGGFHLFDNKNDTIELARQLSQYGLGLLAPCHCTGPKSIEMFKAEFSKVFHRLSTGDSITIE